MVSSRMILVKQIATMDPQKKKKKISLSRPYFSPGLPLHQSNPESNRLSTFWPLREQEDAQP